ncbi:MAG: alanine racemase [bacterium]
MNAQHFSSHKNRLRCWCEISLAALKHNLRAIRRKIGPRPAIMGLVKANAYGHGLIPIARFLAQNDCQELGCAHVGEAQALRKAGVRLPILLLSGFLEEELPEAILQNLMITVSSLEECRMVERAARSLKRRSMVQIKINTGMGRLGADCRHAAQLMKAVQTSQWLDWKGVFTHHACADSDKDLTLRQWRAFESARARGVRHHSCNSAAVFILPQAHGDGVRPGLAFYGVSPIPKFQKLLRPALSWKARITFVRDTPKGATLSYGATYRTPRRMDIATVAVGYGDGLFRSLSNKGEVLVSGQRCRILGRVTMDQILVDVSRVKNAKKGTEVVLLGKQGNQSILASEMAKGADTIPYEIWTSITERVPRFYI